MTVLLRGEPERTQAHAVAAGNAAAAPRAIAAEELRKSRILIPARPSVSVSMADSPLILSLRICETDREGEKDNEQIVSTFWRYRRFGRGDYLRHAAKSRRAQSARFSPLLSVAASS